MTLLLRGRADRPIVDRLQEPGSLADVHGRPRAIQLRDLIAEMLDRVRGTFEQGRPTQADGCDLNSHICKVAVCWIQSFDRASAPESERGVSSDTRPT